MRDVDPFLIHGVLMLLAWIGLLPTGVLVARYLKVRRGQDFPRELDNPLWFYFHVASQYAGMAIACLGVVIVWNALGSFDVADRHAQLGAIVMSLGILQIVASWLRGTKGGPTDKGADPARPETWRGDHYDMTLRRRLFEVWHKTAGYVALALAVPTAMMGLDRLGVPNSVQLLPAALAVAFVVAMVLFERAGRRVPTYWAIWGPDPTHPGNRPRSAHMTATSGEAPVERRRGRDSS